MYRALRVNRAGYYAWRKTHKSERAKELANGPAIGDGSVIGFGAAATGSLLAAFNTHQGDTHGATAALHANLLYAGGITLSSTLIFWQLAKTRPHPKEIEAVAQWR